MEEMLDMDRERRVAVVGASCAGKTTFARRLSRALDVPHVELDALYWGPGWSPAPPEDFRASVRDAIAAPAWVVDGNYSAVRDLVWGRATSIVWLDLPFRVVFSRALGRTIRRAITREELFGGNRESLRGITDRDWIPWWVLRTFRERRRRYEDLLRRPEFAHLRVLRLTRPAEADAILETGDGHG